MGSMEENPETRPHASGDDMAPDKPDGKTGRRQFIDKTLRTAGAAGIAHFLLLGARNRVARADTEGCGQPGKIDLCQPNGNPSNPDVCSTSGEEPDDLCTTVPGDGDECPLFSSGDVCNTMDNQAPRDDDMCRKATPSSAELGDSCGWPDNDDVCNEKMSFPDNGDAPDA